MACLLVICASVKCKLHQAKLLEKMPSAIIQLTDLELVTTQEKARDVWGKTIFIDERRKKKITPWERREGKTIKQRPQMTFETKEHVQNAEET